MAVNITNAFNTGRDVSVVLMHPLAPGGRLDFEIVTDFDAKVSYHDIKITGLDGYTRTKHVPDQGMISFTVERNNAVMDAFCWTLWRSYKDSGRLPDGKIYQYVRELDGSTTTTEYNGVAFKVDDLGSFKKDSQVTQKLTGTFMDARVVA